MRLYLLSLLFFLGSLQLAAQTSTIDDAQAAFSKSQWQDAFLLFKTARTNFETVNDFAGIVQCDEGMADCLIRQSDFISALQFASNAERLIKLNLPNENKLLAKSFQLQGESYLNLGRNTEAVEKLKLAEDLLGNQPSLELSDCYNLLGLTYWNNLNTELALQYLEQSLAIRKQLLPPTALPIADVYNNLGLVHLGLDDAKASEYFQEALRLYRDLLGEENAKVGYALINLAKVRAGLGWYDEAIDYLNIASRIWQKIHGAKDHQAKAYSIIVKGQIHQMRRQYNEAHEAFNDALAQYKRLFGEHHPEVANTYFQIGSLWQEQSAFKSALGAFQKAIFANLPGQSFNNNYDQPRIHNYLNADYLLSALMAKAKILEALHFEKSLKARDLKVALDTYLAADTLVTAIRQVRASEADKLKLGATANLIYENGIRLALVLADLPMFFAEYEKLAFHFCERSKAALLLSAIQDSQAKSFADIPPHVLQEEDSLKNTINYLQQLIAKGDGNDATKKQLFEAERQFRFYLQVLENKYPNYFKLKHESKIATITDIQLKLGVNELMLSYFEGKDQLYIFYISKNKVDHAITDKPEIWSKMVAGFRNSIYYKVSDQYALADQLYANAFPKLIEKGITKLIIIPSGHLFQLPMEALQHPETHRYIIQDYTVTYAYAATLWANATLKNATSNVLLAVAPITFDTHPVRLANLDGTKKEISDIKNLFLIKGFASDVLSKEMASEETIKQKTLDQFRYIHFATHGEVNMTKPALSRIFLQPGNSEDGSLYTGEIFALKFNADLVTLSACETGLGQMAAGEGILGLSRALLYAGAQNLIVSQWKVSDYATAMMMTKFYDALLSHPDKSIAVALREAKLFLLAQNDFKQPYFWAPFILIGN